MKTHRIPLLAVVLWFAALAGCDQQTGSAEALKLAEERAAIEREKAALALEKAASAADASERERARLAEERAALEAEKARLAAASEQQKDAERASQLAAEREKRMAAERRAAEQAEARNNAEAREKAAREEAAQAVARARASQTVEFFYDALDPFGDWVQIERYGYAFRPGAARDPLWRPYTDGSWVYTEYGWTWRSNEPFGWATYHYGRWARVPRLGWVWVPATEWGPAWVSWRRSNDYVGWAPLPPDAWSPSGFNVAVDAYFDIGPGLYTFLRVGDFGEPTYLGRVVAPEQNITIIQNTVNVTNVVYQKVENKTVIINQGPDIAVINRSARRPVPRLTVQRFENSKSLPAQVEGGALKILAPVLKDARPGAKPGKVSEVVKGGNLDRGWTAGAPSERFRADAARQAREAEESERRPRQPSVPGPAAQKPAPRPTATPEPIAKPAPEPPPITAIPVPAPSATPSPVPPRERPAPSGGAPRPGGILDRPVAPPARPGRNPTPAVPEAQPAPEPAARDTAPISPGTEQPAPPPAPAPPMPQPVPASDESAPGTGRPEASPIRQQPRPRPSLPPGRPPEAGESTDLPAGAARGSEEVRPVRPRQPSLPGGREPVRPREVARPDRPDAAQGQGRLDRAPQADSERNAIPNREGRSLPARGAARQPDPPPTEPTPQESEPD